MRVSQLGYVRDMCLSQTCKETTNKMNHAHVHALMCSFGKAAMVSATTFNIPIGPVQMRWIMFGQFSQEELRIPSVCFCACVDVYKECQIVRKWYK